ncbi:MAG TPA: glycosyltransferase [Gemmatimonadaceae bacterium]|nr:glycosyltransferase [Gemmatimonadaceae bacterium]
MRESIQPFRAAGTRAPALSVVVIMFSAREQLERCLDALAEQAARIDLEVLVPHDDTLDRPEELQAGHPGVRLLRFAGCRTPAELRAAAVADARAPVVALLEDHCTPAADWCMRVLALHGQPHAAVGGSIEKGFPPGRSHDTALNWALYLSDYSRYMPPMPPGPAHGLSDCNVSYKRAALEAIRELWRTEFHENVVNGALERSGRTLWFDPGLVVYEQRPLDLRRALRDRYTFGRLFGSTRVASSGLPVRVARAGVAVLMPPLLVGRVARNLVRRRRHRAQLLRCLPWLMLVSAAWMWGEAVGYLTGAPDASLTATSSRGGGDDHVPATGSAPANAGPSR